jgi:hypothetical protein
MNFKSNLIIQLLIAPYFGLAPLIGFVIIYVQIFGMIELKYLLILIGLIHLWGFVRYFYFCTNIKIFKNNILIEKDYLFYKKEISLDVESIKYVSVKYHVFEIDYKRNHIPRVLCFLFLSIFESIFFLGYHRVRFYEKERFFSFNFSNLESNHDGEGDLDLMIGELRKNGLRCEEE